jgi:predicted alpha/beta hydrolase family esterase
MRIREGPYLIGPVSRAPRASMEVAGMTVATVCRNRSPVRSFCIASYRDKVGICSVACLTIKSTAPVPVAYFVEPL